MCVAHLLLPGTSQEQDTTGHQIIDEAVREEANDSQILHPMHVLADIYGPRLTGSHNEMEASRWTVREMELWGMDNAHLERWHFGHAGWSNVSSSGTLWLQSTINSASKSPHGRGGQTE